MNQQDLYGRSPLHVAAAVDYTEMLEFLLQNGADIDIKTAGEGQTAMHYAAKNDAINSLEMLLGYGANIDARDSKNRTPLQVHNPNYGMIVGIKWKCLLKNLHTDVCNKKQEKSTFHFFCFSLKTPVCNKLFPR